MHIFPDSVRDMYENYRDIEQQKIMDKLDNDELTQEEADEELEKLLDYDDFAGIYADENREN